MTPTVKTLERYWDRDTAVQLRGILDGTTDPLTLAPVERWAAQCASAPRDVDQILEACNVILDTCGIEAIFCDRHIDSYHLDIAALYCNTGDTYDPTVLYDTARDRFVVTSYGDWVETAERTRRYQFS